MLHDQCDYCFREFGYQPGAKAVCVNCGLENIRPAASPKPKPPKRKTKRDQ